MLDLTTPHKFQALVKTQLITDVLHGCDEMSTGRTYTERYKNITGPTLKDDMPNSKNTLLLVMKV